MQDEAQLIRAAARGDRSAFDGLVRAKREKVVRIAYQLTGDREDALDVAQVVFLKLWKSLGGFDLQRRFDTWLYRVTVNAAIDLLRSRGPQGVFSPLEDDPADYRTPAHPTAEAAIDLGRLRRVFSRLASALAPRQRAAFVLREIEGLETAEVATILGVSESTIRNHVLHARRILREGLLRHDPNLAPKGRGDGEGES